MNSHPLAPILDAEVDAFWRDGVACLRGLFDAEWIAHMRDAVEEDLANPGPLAREYAKKGGRFLGDIGAWAVKPGLRHYVEQFPILRTTREQMDQRVHELRESLSTTNTPGQRKSRGDERTR